MRSPTRTTSSSARRRCRSTGSSWGRSSLTCARPFHAQSPQIDPVGVFRRAPLPSELRRRAGKPKSGQGRSTRWRKATEVWFARCRADSIYRLRPNGIWGVRGCGPARPVEDCAATARCLLWVQSCTDSPTADEVDEMAQASPTTSDRPSSVRLQVPPASARARSAQSIKGYPEHPFIPSFCRRISAPASCAGRCCSMAAAAGRRLPFLPGACATPC
jgi:hypothetical protein